MSEMEGQTPSLCMVGEGCRSCVSEGDPQKNNNEAMSPALQLSPRCAAAEHSPEPAAFGSCCRGLETFGYEA